MVIDCGTGGHALARKLISCDDNGRRGNILISHTHWDHIQGIPFFDPLFVCGNEWDIYGPRGLRESLHEALAGQMQYTYFPVSLDQCGANIRYHDLVEGSFAIGDIRVSARYSNHPVLTLGYRLQVDGATLVYACDHEPHSRMLSLGDGKITGEDLRHAEFMERADLLIHDAQYTAEEYPEKIGWGHSPVEYVLKHARAGDVDDVLATSDRFAYEESMLINVGDEKGALLDVAVRRADPKLALELGTYCGYGALRIARAAPAAKVYSVELAEANAVNARQIWAHAGVADRVTCVVGTVGDGGHTLDALAGEHGFTAGALDFVFLDHDKDAYLSDLQSIVDRGWLHTGSIVVADNVKVPGAPKYREYMRQQQGKLFNTTEHKTHVEYQSLISDLVLESEYLGG